MKLSNQCTECGHEWGQNFSMNCPKCGSSEIYTETEYDYQEITIEDVLDMMDKGFYVYCDADTKTLDFTYTKE